VGTFGNVAAETQMRMSGTPLAAITFVHSGRPRVIRLPVSLRPSSRRGLENFGSKVIGPRLCSSNRDRQRLTCGCSLLSESPARPGALLLLRVQRRRWENAREPLGVAAPAARLTSCLLRVDWPAQPYLNLAQRLFQQYFIKCFRRVSPIGIGRTSWRT